MVISFIDHMRDGIDVRQSETRHRQKHAKHGRGQQNAKEDLKSHFVFSLRLQRRKYGGSRVTAFCFDAEGTGCESYCHYGLKSTTLGSVLYRTIHAPSGIISAVKL